MSKAMAYELGFLITPGLDKKQIEEVFKKIEGLVSETGNIKRTETPKKISLAYPIQKKRDGFLAAFVFEAEPKKIGALKEKVEKTPEIVRFLVVRKEVIREEKEETFSLSDKKATSETTKKEKTPSPAQEKVELEEIEKGLDKILES